MGEVIGPILNVNRMVYDEKSITLGPISDNTHIGYLSPDDTSFVCLNCASDRVVQYNCKCYRVNIGIYSQQCSVCKRLVIDGVKRGDGKGPLNLFDRGI